MKQEIKPAYITFEQAKWLKENRFIEPTLTYWSKRDGLIENEITLRNHNERGEWSTSRPEQWQVVEWLRVNHGIWVSVDWCFSEKKPSTLVKWSFNLSNVGNREKSIILSKTITFYNSPQEAYSAAFDYIKDNNLI
jgi:hypothetical protein